MLKEPQSYAVETETLDVMLFASLNAYTMAIIILSDNLETLKEVAFLTLNAS